jgi:hypothetical protein
MKSCLIWLHISGDLFRLLALALRSKSSLVAENLFLRKQLAFYRERKIKPRRTDNPTRLMLVLLGCWFDWRNVLAVVTPRTFIGWHRKGLRLFWRFEMPIRPAADSAAPPASDSQDGVRQPVVGRRASCKRVAAETRSSRVAAYDP